MGLKRGLSIDADSGPLGYLLWCSGSRSWLWPYCGSYSCKPRNNTTLKMSSFDKKLQCSKNCQSLSNPFSSCSKTQILFLKTGTSTLFPICDTFGKVFHDFFIFSISDCQICNRNSKTYAEKISDLFVVMRVFFFCLIYNNNSP